MKKIVTLILSFLVCAMSLVGCNTANDDTEKANFEAAINAMTNYEAAVYYEPKDSFPFSSIVKVVENKFYLDVPIAPTYGCHYEMYAYISDGKMYVYENEYELMSDSLIGTTGWYTAQHNNNPFDATYDYTCYINKIATLKYEDVNKDAIDENCYNLKEDKCKNFYVYLDGFKMYIEGAKIKSATAWLSNGIEIKYSFINFNTSIELPSHKAFDERDDLIKYIKEHGTKQGGTFFYCFKKLWT